MFSIRLTVLLNHEEIKKDPQKITKIKPFINKHEAINFLSEKDDWKKIEKNNVTITLKKQKTSYSFNDSKWRKTTLSCSKQLSALLREITSKNNGDFYCLNCHHSFRTKNTLEFHKNVCENKDFRNVIMSSKNTKTLEFNQYQKSDKVPFIIYADLERIIKKNSRSKNNPEN